jgi:hypothetical protein
MIRWLRIVSPPLGRLIFFALVYGSAAGGSLALHRRFGFNFGVAHERVATQILIFGTLGYALWRTLAFHPLFVPGYESWLAATPWTSRQPLPMGPVHLVLQDVVLLGAVVGFAWLTGDVVALYVPQLFLAIYLLVLSISLFRTGFWPWGYAVLFGLGLMGCLWHDLPICGSAALATYTIAYLGLRRSLASFPWTGDWSSVAAGVGIQLSNTQNTINTLGWPFGRLSPTGPGLREPLSAHHALLSSMIVGWWTFAVGLHFPLLPAFVLAVLGFLVPMARVVIYCDGYGSPLSLLGRLLTGRWIIPGYDQVYVAPVLAVVVGASVASVTLQQGLNPAITLPIGVVVVLFICLGLGPSLRAWRLTGNHRITEGSQRNAAVKVG